MTARIGAEGYYLSFPSITPACIVDYSDILTTKDHHCISEDVVTELKEELPLYLPFKKYRFM